jgi:hypothetical protein
MAEEDTKLELDIRRLLAAEVKEHREFLEKQFRQIMWSIGIVLAVALATFVYFVGKTKQELQEELRTTVSQTMTEYRINHELQARLSKMVEKAAEDVANSKTVSDSVASQVQTKTKDFVTTELQKVVASVLAKQVTPLKESDVLTLVNRAAESAVRFTIHETGRVGTGPDVKRANQPRKEALGVHAFCALGSTNMTKDTRVCGCQLSPEGTGPNPSWLLQVNAEQDEIRHCECTAICFDRLSSR